MQVCVHRGGHVPTWICRLQNIKRFCILPSHWPTEIFKKSGDVLLTAKAYNGRIILEWLSDTVCSASTHGGYADMDSRFFLIAAALKHIWP